MTAEETCNLILEEFKARSGVKTYVGIDHMIIAYGSNGTKIPGVYRQALNELYFCAENQPDRALEILLHEIAHATIPVLGRSCMNYYLEEVIAETTAGIILSGLGLMTPQIDADIMQYISNYANYLAPAALDRAKDKAYEAADYILKNWLPDFAKACGKKAV